MDTLSQSTGVDYRLEIAEPNAHLFRVRLTLARPESEQVFSLPTWIPGSYLVRDFSRHLSRLSAAQGGSALQVAPLGKTRWLVRCSGRGALTLDYDVYAFDGSPRGAFLDAQRGFFNGSSVFLQAEGHEACEHRLALGPLPAGWDVATAMDGTPGEGYRAADYDELIDHPFELGRFWRGDFLLDGVPHEVTVTGAWPGFDGARLLAEVQRVCRPQAALWNDPEATPLALPFARYVFLLRVSDDVHGGGLEHRASTALHASRRDLPRLGQAEAGEGWTSLLSLFAHEYFHAWNVKRLRPRDLEPLVLSREQPTTLLWFFEGVTSYYDELALLRAGLVDAATYLRGLARTVSSLLAQPGRRLQSVAQASHDAWIKLYKSDENTPNATVSYYAKGALVALLLDLALRRQGSSLDIVLRTLWQRSSGGPIDETDILAAVEGAGGTALCERLHAWVHGTDELPLAEALSGAGVCWAAEAGSLAARLGLRLSEGPVSGVQVRQVLRGSAAEAAGLAAGDELIAINGWRLRRFDDARQWLSAEQPTAPFELLLVRDQRMLGCQVHPPADAVSPTVTLSLDARTDAPAPALALRRGWLGV